MALVAYGSSDESGSGSEDEEPPARQPPSLPPPQPPPPSLRSLPSKPATGASSILGLPPPKNVTSHRTGKLQSLETRPRTFVPDGKDVEDRKQRTGLDLPPPKTLNTGQEGITSSRSSLFSTLPPPKTSRTEGPPSLQSDKKTVIKSKLGLPAPRREPVKISIPALPEPDSDEEDEPAPKKPKAAPGSGLASLLPAPKGGAAASVFSRKKSVTPTPAAASSAKENTTVFNKKEDFVPYTLTKNKTSATSATAASTKTASQSVPSDKKNVVGVGPAEPIQTASAAKLAKLNMLKKLTKDEVSAEDDGSDEEDQSTSFFSLDSKDDTSVSPNPDTLLPIEPNFDYSIPASSMSASVTSSQIQGPSTGPYVDPNPYNQYSETGPYMQYNQPYDYSDYNQQSYSGDTEQQDQIQATLEPAGEPYGQDEMFVRMQGKKNRGEEVKIIDVHEDSQRAKMEDWKIQMDAEEKEFMLSRSKKSGKLPTRQQRNKHQITYLAFQAKERELELKNQWSQNRMTKRQTQAKYGF